MLSAAEQMPPETFWERVVDKSLTIFVLAAAVYYIGKLFLKSQEAKDNLYAQQLARQDMEMTQLRERARSMEARITESEVKLKECERDRAELRAKVGLPPYGRSQDSA